MADPDMTDTDQDAAGAATGAPEAAAGSSDADGEPSDAGKNDADAKENADGEEDADTEEKDAEAVRESVDDATKVSGGLWITYLGVLFYLLITVGSVTHRDLLLDSRITLPVVNVMLPLTGFFSLGPALFLIVHVYVLLHFVMLADKIAAYDDRLVREVGDREKRTQLRRRLPSNIFVQFLAGPSDVRDGVTGLLLWLIALISLVIAPVLLLLFFQLQFLPYHNELITWWQRVAVVIDLGFIWLFWRKIALRTADTAPGGQTRSFRFVRALQNGGTIVIMLALTVGSVPLLFLIATFPGEKLEQGVYWIEKPARTLIPKSVWIPLRVWLVAGAPNPLTSRPDSHFSNILVLPGLDVIDHAKLDTEAKIAAATPVSLRGRDLRGAVLIRANLRNVDFTGAHLERAVLDQADLRGAKLGCTLPDNTLDHWREEFFKTGRGGRGFQEDDRDYKTIREARHADIEPIEVSRKHEPVKQQNICTHLEGVGLWEAQLQGADLHGAYLQQAELEGADLRGANLRKVQLQCANLFSADLRGADLKEADLAGATFAFAFLQGASLYRAQAQDAFFKNTDLRGADLSKAALQGASFLDGRLDGAILSGAQIQGDVVTLKGAILKADTRPWERDASTPAEREQASMPVELEQASLADWIERNPGSAPADIQSEGQPTDSRTEFQPADIRSEFKSLNRLTSEFKSLETLDRKRQDRLGELAADTDPEKAKADADTRRAPQQKVFYDTTEFYDTVEPIWNRIGCDTSGAPYVMQGLISWLEWLPVMNEPQPFPGGRPLAVSLAKGFQAEDCDGRKGLSPEDSARLKKIISEGGVQNNGQTQVAPADPTLTWPVAGPTPPAAVPAPTTDLQAATPAPPQIKGQVEGLSPDGWPIVGSTTVQLSGVDMVAAGQGSHILAWIKLHRSYLDCDLSRGGTTYVCHTSDRLDLAVAMLENRAAHATADASPWYHAAEQTAQDLKRSSWQQ